MLEAKLTVAQMKDLLRARGLQVTGLKADLAHRLAQRPPPQTEEDPPPSDKQLEYIRDLERDLGENAPAAVFVSKASARMWIREAEVRRREKRDGKKHK